MKPKGQKGRAAAAAAAGTVEDAGYDVTRRELIFEAKAQVLLLIQPSCILWIVTRT